MEFFRFCLGAVLLLFVLVFAVTTQQQWLPSAERPGDTDKIIQFLQPEPYPLATAPS